jgi:hypothetical protein
VIEAVWDEPSRVKTVTWKLPVATELTAQQ